MEGVMASSTFDSALYAATSNSSSNGPSPSDFAIIAENSYTRNGLESIFAVLKKRLESSQTYKWKRIQKCLRLAEYLLINGSPDFVREFKEIFGQRIGFFQRYKIDEPDQESRIRESARRIVSLCEDDGELDQLREKNAAVRARIVSAGSDDIRISAKTGISSLASHKKKDYESIDKGDPAERKNFGFKARDNADKFDVNRFIKKETPISNTEEPDLIGLEETKEGKESDERFKNLNNINFEGEEELL